MAVSPAPPSVFEVVAYRPCAGATRGLTFLITAIGMSSVLQEFVHLSCRRSSGFGSKRPAADHPGAAWTQFHALQRNISNVTIVIVAAALVLALFTDIAINCTKFGRGIRAVAQGSGDPPLMGVSRERSS